MILQKNFRINIYSFLTLFIFAAGLLSIPLTTSCSAAVHEIIRRRRAENFARSDEKRETARRIGGLGHRKTLCQYKNRRVGEILRARIRFETNDFAGAAEILNSDIFKEKTNLGDYALWLRGRALQSAGNHAEAMNVFARVGQRISRIRCGHANRKCSGQIRRCKADKPRKIPNFLSDLNAKHNADALIADGESV